MSDPRLQRQVYDLANAIVQLRGDISGLKAPQLAFSSIEDGAITEYDATDSAVAQYGQQFDGAHIAMPLTGPDPLQPSAPAVRAVPGGLVVAWDGEWVNGLVVPTDFSRVEVHAALTADDPVDTALTLLATFETPRGGEVTLQLDPGIEVFVRLVARSLPGKRGPASDAVAGTPGSVLDSAALDAVTGQVGDLSTQVGDLDAQVGTVTGQVGDLSTIITPWVAPDNVSINGASIEAGSITTDKLDANAVNGIIVTGTTLRTASTGARMVLRPGVSSIGYGAGVLEIFSGNTSEYVPGEIYSIADGPNPTDNISLYIQAPGKVDYVSTTHARAFIQLFAKDADNSSSALLASEVTRAVGIASSRLESGPNDASLTSVRVDGGTGIIYLRSSVGGAAPTTRAAISSTTANFYGDLQVEGISLPRGWCGAANTNSPTSLPSTTAPGDQIVGMTVDLVAGRRYRVTMNFNLQSSVVGDRIVTRVYVGGTSKGLQQYDVTTAGTSFGYSWSMTFTATATGSTLVAYNGYRSAGSGTCQAFASAGQPNFLDIEDIGLGG